MHDAEKDDKSGFAPETLGRRLASRRALLGLSQEDVATRLSVTRQYVSMMERDAYVPSTQLLMRLAELYGVSETWLLHGDGPGACVPRNVDLAPALV